ncbi:MAG TPA: DUF1636 domain-containing protein [Sinorhizobium sp.]|nr:DUF1636 domain-containing protein [Sinorhizobium sp.]
MANSHSPKHKITVSTDCRFTGGPCRPGAALLAMLNRSVSALGKPLSEEFAIAGTVCMATCTRPCTIAFQATGKATYLFGDIAEAENIDHLVDFAATYSERDGGLLPMEEPPGATAGDIVRLPAALIVSEAIAGQLQ